ncbi:unnamed protein product [Vitrella brassicaformis CCMP3155]|uniref:Thioesterase domain-containing protein n=1 Tax=Vitrella brassicaformis (strain CCMP3155) TaxID=1169540 RepID=A0A0G4EXR6_VITBC|nr:unnamed protein product [Vitrella brassicaformis CCMP3155]|eukprot:CEM03404.1 unnamed protein product [Vitrella brassicaformis CCMP3155]
MLSLWTYWLNCVLLSCIFGELQGRSLRSPEIQGRSARSSHRLSFLDRTRKRPFRRHFRVRFDECDLGGIVYHPNHLRYCFDTLDAAFEQRIKEGVLEGLGWDPLMKKTTVVWHRPLKHRDRFIVEGMVTRWGNSSFDVGFVGLASRGGAPVFEARHTFVGLNRTTGRPARVPSVVRAALGDAMDYSKFVQGRTRRRKMLSWFS